MASVTELIAAAEAQKSPFVSMLEGAAQGFGQAQNQNQVRAKLMMDLYKSQQDYQYKQMLNVANEQLIKRHLDEISSDDTGALPQQKYDTIFGMNKSGPYYKAVPKKEPSVMRKGTKVYKDANGQYRYGPVDPATGKVVQSPDDALAPMPGGANRGGGTPSGRGGGSGPNPLTLNKEAYKKAMEWYVNQYPDKVELDPLSGRITRNYVTSEDVDGEEFQSFYRQAEETLRKGPRPPNAKASPKQAGPNTSTPEGYLKSINAKVTPGNIEWAKKKLGGK